jgi:hypothetical protein
VNSIRTPFKLAMSQGEEGSGPSLLTHTIFAKAFKPTLEVMKERPPLTSIRKKFRKRSRELKSGKNLVEAVVCLTQRELQRNLIP